MQIAFNDAMEEKKGEYGWKLGRRLFFVIDAANAVKISKPVAIRDFFKLTDFIAKNLWLRG